MIAGPGPFSHHQPQLDLGSVMRGEQKKRVLDFIDVLENLNIDDAAGAKNWTLWELNPRPFTGSSDRCEAKIIPLNAVRTTLMMKLNS